MNKVGIVIPHYKNKEQLERCQKSIEVAIFNDYVVRVLDNTLDNKGFTRACNDGIRGLWDQVSDYFIILNQDCYLKEDAIGKMVEFMDYHPRCAIGGIKQISTVNDDLIIHGGCTQAFPNGLHVSGSVKKGDCSESKLMPWVNGACTIVRKTAIIDFGLMDENFFLIGSDSDWCYTARDRGWEVWYIAEAECLHEGGESMKPSDDKIKNIMKMDIVHWRDKWISGGVYRELKLEIF